MRPFPTHGGILPSVPRRRFCHDLSYFSVRRYKAETRISPMNNVSQNGNRDPGCGVQSGQGRAHDARHVRDSKPTIGDGVFGDVGCVP